jgi:hypothetical protein
MLFRLLSEFRVKLVQFNCMLSLNLLAKQILSMVGVSRTRKPAPVQFMLQMVGCIDFDAFFCLRRSKGFANIQHGTFGGDSNMLPSSTLRTHLAPSMKAMSLHK